MSSKINKAAYSINTWPILLNINSQIVCGFALMFLGKSIISESTIYFRLLACIVRIKHFFSELFFCCGAQISTEVGA
jgi:hypothetical protein